MGIDKLIEAYESQDFDTLQAEGFEDVEDFCDHVVSQLAALQAKYDPLVNAAIRVMSHGQRPYGTSPEHDCVVSADWLAFEKALAESEGE